MSQTELSQAPVLQAELSPEGPSAPRGQLAVAGRSASLVGSSSTTDEARPTGDGSDLDRAGLEHLLAARYRWYWSEFDAARRAPSTEPAVDHPVLQDLTAGEQLDVSHRNLSELATSGEALREPFTPTVGLGDAQAGHFGHRVRIDSIDGPVARLSGCVVNDDVRYNVATGIIERDSVSTVLSESTMALTEGEWKLIRSRAVEIIDGVSGCWLSDEAEFPL